MAVKKKYPFRLGTTSFILPADMLTNVRHLASKVDDIELLVFESDEMAELPDEEMTRDLRRIADDEKLTYTVHLPLDIWLGDFDAAERARSVSKCVRTIEKMKILGPRGWILHCNRRSSGNNHLEPDRVWVAAVEDSVEKILKCGVEPRSVCVETLDASFPLLEPVIEKYGLSICLDIGHLIFYRLPIDAYLRKYFSKATVIHLHGVIEGKDHRDIGGVEPSMLTMLNSAMKTDGVTDRIVTIEVFSEKDFETSLKILGRYFL